MIDDTSPRSCVVCGVALVGKAVLYCGRAHRLEAARERRRAVDASPEAKAVRDRIMGAVRRTGLTVDARTVAGLLGVEGKRGMRAFRRRLRELLRLGEVGKVGSRYFPIEWVSRKQGGLS